MLQDSYLKLYRYYSYYYHHPVFILSSSNYCSYLFNFCLINYGHDDVDVSSNSG